MQGLEYDSITNSLQPREQLQAVVEELALVLDTTTAAAASSHAQAALPLPPLDNLTLPHVLDWTIDDVGEWFEHALKLPQYRDLAMANAVDGLLLVELDDDDLETELRIEDQRHRDVILAWIRALKRKGEPEAA